MDVPSLSSSLAFELAGGNRRAFRARIGTNAVSRPCQAHLRRYAAPGTVSQVGGGTPPHLRDARTPSPSPRPYWRVIRHDLPRRVAGVAPLAGCVINGTVGGQPIMPLRLFVNREPATVCAGRVLLLGANDPEPPVVEGRAWAWRRFALPVALRDVYRAAEMAGTRALLAAVWLQRQDRAASASVIRRAIDP